MIEKDILAEVVAFGDAAEEATSLPGLSSLVEEITRELGFRWFTLIRASGTGDANRGSFLLTNYPAGWVEQVFEEKRHLDDPIHAAVLRSIDGIGWEEVGAYIDPTNRQQETMAKAGDFGLKTGLTLPFRLTGSSTAMFSVAQSLTRPLTRKKRLVARMLGAIAFRKAHELSFGRNTVSNRVRLSHRQIDCIALLAQGLTDFEIARRLNLSPHSIREYVSTARNRYGVKRRIQLVLAAMRDGYISLEGTV